MPVTLYVDGERWRAHLRAVQAANPGLVPVAKGNGYGLGVPRLARKAGWLDVDTLAVGTYMEAEEAASRFDGSLLVLSPYRAGDEAAVFDKRVIHTVGRLEDLDRLASRDDRPRVVLEQLTSMRRHGFTATDLRRAGQVVAAGARLRAEGVAMHLPISQHSHAAELERLLTDTVAAGLASTTVFVSHLTDTELTSLAGAFPDFTFRPRIGTELWLGDRGALSVRATVLDAHPVERGDVFGYRGRAAPRPGTILVVSGGTAHGIGLEAPLGDASLRQRAATIAKGGLDAVGFVRSPYTIDGKQRLFAEPPHMQISMLYLPMGARVPEVGDEVDVRVRYTATGFDRTLVS